MKQIKADLNFIYNTDMNKLKENLDFLYTCKTDLEEKVVELQDEIHALKGNSACFLVDKDTAQMEVTVLKDQLTTLSESLNREKCRSASDINYWKLKYDGMEGNHKYAVNHCTELNRTITLYKDEVKKLKDAKVNDEQLARQLLVKKQELENTLKKIATLEKENEDYRGQTFRLVNENSKFSCPGMYLSEVQKCGKCVSCQLLEASARVQQVESVIQDKNAELVQANRVRQELSDFLAASKKESEGYRRQMDSLRDGREEVQNKCATLDTAISNLETENKKMYNDSCSINLNNAVQAQHLRSIITILTNGIRNVFTTGIFNRQKVAAQTQEDVKSYIIRNNIERMQIYTGETQVV